jgi:hypothetical protein
MSFLWRKKKPSPTQEHAERKAREQEERNARQSAKSTTPKPVKKKPTPVTARPYRHIWAGVASVGQCVRGCPVYSARTFSAHCRLTVPSTGMFVFINESNVARMLPVGP